jgi:heme exporter protein A
MPSASTSSALPAAAGGLLSARSLACRRGRRLLFKGLDLNLAAGSITWLRGTNGSGKTSLLRMLAGLSAPADGQITLNGPVLYIGHANALKDDLTLGESVAFWAQLAGLDEPRARASRALAALGLANREQAAVRTLSQGQRRRGCLARLALDEAPRTWILDEPFDALDAHSVQVLSGLIEAHAQRGGAVLLTSHQAVVLAGVRELDLEPWRAA